MAQRVNIEQVTEGVFQLRFGRINAWLVHTGASAALIDTGLPAHGVRILAALDELGVPHRRVEAILLTHSHLDHSGSARMLSLACEAPVYVHGADAAAVEGRARLTPCRGVPLGALVEPLIAFSDQRVFKFRPTPVRPVADGDQVAGFRLIHAPGHTPGHSAWLHLDSRVVFSGDAAVHWRQGVLSGPSKLFSDALDQVRASQRRLAELDAACYCFGHGPPLEHGAAALKRLAG